ncbi:hypothetical protein LIER_25040 [Lithospermum erythrorhizon]|uniref:Uncharacterized protein n=1 Tax=Lithospermum erythrorhizon TaxID=34254 RepID=A0AAV3R700_LITER
MEFGEDSRHNDGEILGNVESQTAHINEGVTCYPNEGIADEELGLIVEDSKFEGDFEDEQVRDDEHEYEEEGEDDKVDFDVEDEQVQVHVMFNKYRHLKTPVLIPNMIFGKTLFLWLLAVVRGTLCARWRPKKCRTIDAHEKREKAKKVVAEKEKAATRGGEIHFKNSRKGVVMHYKLCSGAGHNKKTCQLNQPDGGATEPLVNEQARKNKKKGGTKQKVETSISQSVASNLGDGSSSTQPAHGQPPNTSRK